MFITERGESLEPARRVCAACVVRVECLDYALSQSPRVVGVWVGPVSVTGLDATRGRCGVTAGYWFAVTRPDCGGEVDHVADGRPIAGNRSIRGVPMQQVRPPLAPPHHRPPGDRTRIRRPTGQKEGHSMTRRQDPQEVIGELRRHCTRLERDKAEALEAKEASDRLAGILRRDLDDHRDPSHGCAGASHRGVDGVAERHRRRDLARIAILTGIVAEGTAGVQ